MTSRVVIIGPPDDDQVAAVETAVRAAGGWVHVHHMCTSDVDNWTWTPDCIDTPDGIRLTSASGVYVRSIPLRPPSHGEEWVRPDEETAWLEAAARYQRVHGFLKSVQLALGERGIEVVNPLSSYMFHRSKPAADLTLAAAGIPVPRGVATSDPALVDDLVDRVGSVVYKPVAGGGRCRELEPASMEAEGPALAIAPVYFQEHIRGQNIRIYTIGDELLAAFVIESIDVDFRGRESAIIPFTPTEDVTVTAVRAAAALGMVFAGSDIKLLPDGRHVVLDVNPSPMFAGLDHLVGDAIAAGLARRLMVSSP